MIRKYNKWSLGRKLGWKWLHLTTKTALNMAPNWRNHNPAPRVPQAAKNTFYTCLLKMAKTILHHLGKPYGRGTCKKFYCLRQHTSKRVLEHSSQSIGLTVSQPVSQSGRQAVNETGRHAGRNTQLGFLGVSLHLQTKKRLSAAATNSSREEKRSEPEQTNGGSIPRPTRWPG